MRREPHLDGPRVPAEREGGAIIMKYWGPNLAPPSCGPDPLDSQQNHWLLPQPVLKATHNLQVSGWVSQLDAKSFKTKEQIVFCRKIAKSFKYKDFADFRCESPISISKWNNCSDFRRESENYFKTKVFSDSRRKSAQKLILKFFADFQLKIICRLSDFFKI